VRIAAVECLFVFFLVAGISLTALALYIGSSQSRTSRWNAALAHVAQRFHGVYAAGGWFNEPSVRMIYGPAQTRLTCYRLPGDRHRMVAQLVIEQVEVRCRCEIASQPASVPLVVPQRGLAPVELDWGNQYARWQVLAADLDEARHHLTDAVRLALDRLWLHPLPTDTTVSLLPGWIIIRKVWDQPRGADLEQFVELGCMLNDQIQLAGAAGIEFVAGEEAQLVEDASCGVCCESLAGEIVLCLRCHAPHHRDCWEYGGGCATYGCGGRMSYQPGRASIAQAPHFPANGSAESNHAASDRAASSHAGPSKPR
jgi:hypothetical protein